MSESMGLSVLSETELDVVGAGWGHFTQISGGNVVVGVQVAPTVNLALFSGGVMQFGASQSQFLNGGNIA